VIVVVDASVAAKWFVAEKHSETAALLLTPEYELVSPDLILLEVGSVLLRSLRRREITPKDCHAIQAELLPGALRLIPAAEHATAAFEIAHGFGGSIYDAAYLAIARLIDAPLVTDDAGLVRVARAAKIEARLIADGLPGPAP
jgi:predicted nucleic acid-binding protein